MKPANRKCERGSALIETALLLPVLLLLALGVADLGRVFYNSIVVTNSARAATGYALRERYGDIMGMKTAAVQDASTNLKSGTFTASNVTPQYYCQCPGDAIETVRSCTGILTTCAAPMIYVKVTTTYTFNTLLNYPGIPTSVPLTGNSTMRVR